jgi:Cu+-exporting ATPase
MLAELVAWRHTRRRAPELREALDPVCGMTVTTHGSAEATVHGGLTYYFCSANCRARFEAEPERYLTSGAA